MRRMSSRTMATPFFATSARRPTLGGNRPIVNTEPPLSRASRRLGLALFVFFVLIGAALFGFHELQDGNAPYSENLRTVILLLSVAPAAVSYIAGRALAWVFS
jgi:magnesium-transporting ATPase (P-type)